MIRDLEQGLPEPGLRSDVCVVGAGAAGIALTVELLRLGKSVTLLEGGGAAIEPDAQEPYQSEVIGRPHRGIHAGRFRAQGGTTLKWGGQILQLTDEDFARRDWVAGSGWPFDRQTLVPWYARALEVEGLGNVLSHDADVWAASGQPEPAFGPLLPYFSRWCPEPNFARLHAETLSSHPGLSVWLHANAVELVLQDGVAQGIRCRTQTGREQTFHAEAYVFCLGAIESTRFFLQPRATGLPWNESGLLGRHFQDHIDANAALVRPRSRKRFHELFDNVFAGGLKYHPKLRLSAAEQASRQTLNVAATMHFQSSSDEALGRIKATAKSLLKGRLGEVSAADVTSLAANLPALARQTYRYAVQHRAYNPADSVISLRVHSEQQPLSASSLTLSDQRDRLGLLRTRLDWQIADQELASIRAFIEVATQALAGVADIIPDPDLMAGNPSFLDRCDDSNHHIGGMRMASAATDGVVTPQLQLHGVANTFICSAAVFPTSGFSNPTHTLLALAMRLADHLR